MYSYLNELVLVKCVLFTTWITVRGLWFPPNNALLFRDSLCESPHNVHYLYINHDPLIAIVATSLQYPCDLNIEWLNWFILSLNRNERNKGNPFMFCGGKQYSISYHSVYYPALACLIWWLKLVLSTTISYSVVYAYMYSRWQEAHFKFRFHSGNITRSLL